MENVSDERLDERQKAAYIRGTSVHYSKRNEGRKPKKGHFPL